MIKHPCELALRSSLAAATLRASNIPGIIGLHCLLLSYLISFTHVLDTQRKFRVTNECCKHKRILFLCRFFGNCFIHLEKVPRINNTDRGWRLYILITCLPLASYLIDLGLSSISWAVPSGSLSWNFSWYMLLRKIAVII